MRAIIFAKFITNNRVIATSKAWRKLQVHAFVIHLIDLNGFYLFQLTDALLHLNGLGCLITKTLDESFCVGYFFLLVFIGAQLLLSSFSSQHDILIVFYFIVFDVATSNLYRTVGYIIDESTVVTDQHHCFGWLSEKLFQPLYRLDVEMVGWFVQQQHVRATQQNLRQFDSHAPTTRELGRRTVKIGLSKAQSGECSLHFGLIVLAAHHQIAIMFLRKLLHQFHVRRTLIVGAVAQFVLHVLKVFLHAHAVRKSLSCFFLDSCVVGYLHHLRKITNGGVIRNRNDTRSRFLLAVENLE